MLGITRRRIVGIIARSVHIIKSLVDFLLILHHQIIVWEGRGSTYSVLCLYGLKMPIVHLMIQLRDPVIAPIDINAACCRIRILGRVLLHCPLES